MKSLILTFIAIALATAKTGHTQTVDCEYVFTNLERAICTNPELDALDKEFGRLLALAVRQKSLTPRAGREMRNHLALRCGRAENMVSCLVAQEREAISRLALVTGEMFEVAASHRSTELSATSYNALRSNLSQAEKLHRQSGKVKNLVSATLDLLNLYRGDGVQHLPAELRGYEVQALQSRIIDGCKNLREQHYWRQGLQARGQSCADGLRLVDRD